MLFVFSTSFITGKANPNIVDKVVAADTLVSPAGSGITNTLIHVDIKQTLIDVTSLQTGKAGYILQLFASNIDWNWIIIEGNLPEASMQIQYWITAMR